MKTLHLSIIVISLIGISFFIGENAYGCLGTCPPIPTPPHYDSPTITVNTNLENYATTDKLIISSHVFNPSNKIPLVIKIFNPNRDLESVKIFPLSSNENYTWTISPPIDFYYSGNYTVLSQFGEYYAVTHFYLNSTITQYYLSQAPLKQLRMGTFAQDVHCHTGLQLFFKAEDYTPACAQSETATMLIQRGWAVAHLPESFIAKFAITGLRQNYPVGQPINATVTYSGYYWYAEPEVKILDANGTQIWFNCPYCYTRTELAQLPSSHTFTYTVRDYASNKIPVINKTGTYTMIASLHNKTSSAEFTIVKSLMLHASFEPCDTPFQQSNRGIAVLYMPANSIGKICARYTNPNEPKNASLAIVDALSYRTTKSITSWAEPSMIPSGNSTVRYSIKTGNQTGLYGLTIFCYGVPFAVGYDDKSNFTLNDFPWEKSQTINCPMMTYQYRIDSLSGIGVKYIPSP